MERFAARYAALAAVVIAVVAATLLLALPGSARSSANPQTRLGSRLTQLRSHRCGSHPVVDCGYAHVPLDWHRPATSPRIRIAYRWWPARDHHAKSTIVAVEGGPGYASVGTASWYRVMYGSDLRDHNLLIVDNRGTGGSTPVDCQKLQKISPRASTARVEAAAYSCGRKLDHRWKYRHGGWVHAADMFGTVPAANDMAALIEDLHTGPVSIYGDSYGTYFVQVFAEQHPQLVKDAVLDSAYQVHHLDPWYTSTMSGLRRTVKLTCEEALACRSRFHDAWTAIAALVKRLDRHSVSAVVPSTDGHRRRVTVTSDGIVNLLSDAGADVYIYRQIAAAAEAVVEHGDAAPLARLYSQRLAVDESYTTTPYHEYSAGLYVATSCTDYPQLFSMQSSFAARAKQLKAAIARENPKLFSPFTVKQWLSQNFNTEALTVCMRWPRVAKDREAPQLPAKHLSKHVPVLILSGKLDIWTPAAGDHEVARQIGGHVKIVHFANATHVLGEEDTVCGDTVISEFVAHPYGHLNSSCAPKIAAIHTLGAFPASVSAVPMLGAAKRVRCSGKSCPAEPRGAAISKLRAGRLTVAAIDTAGDALARYMAIDHRHDLGLYAGKVTAYNGGNLLRLAGDELILGVKVSGSVSVKDESGGRYAVRAALRARDSSKQTVAVRARWSSATDAYAQALVSGPKLHLSGRTAAP